MRAPVHTWSERRQRTVVAYPAGVGSLGEMARPVAAAIDAAGPALQEVARVKGWKRTVERDLQRAVEAASGARSSPVRLEHWPGVGSVDVMFPGQTAIELKWCKSGDTLANCAWDIAKLASALAEDEIEAGLIVAGAPASHWASSASGVELFDAITYEGDELVRRYESWWRFWCKDVVTRPINLPQATSIAPADRIPIELDGEPFELRMARVHVIDGQWRPHVCPHRWQGELCPPRVWDTAGLTYS